MFVYRLAVNPLLAVEVSLASADPDGHAPLQFRALPRENGLEGVAEIVAMIRDEVGALTGLEGHLLGAVTTPADLHAALREQLTRYAPELTAGASIIEGRAPEPLPPGAAR